MLNTIQIPEFTLESGTVMRQVPVAYRTWGERNAEGTNAVLVCHTLTANTDVSAWWSTLLGPGGVLDTDRYFVICMNMPGSPYGSVSPLTPNPDTGLPYGPTFPIFTVRDTVALHKRVLDALGVRRVVFATGGSMGGMQVLEWAFYGDFVQALIPIAVGGRYSAWGVGWTEAQRQAIYADPRWKGGYYDPDDPPVSGLAMARMLAMISYQSWDAFEQRFRAQAAEAEATLPEVIESYLRYQGDRLVRRFDTNCYVTLTRQVNTHDVARERGAYPDVLRQIRQPTLVVGIDSDVLYPVREQEELVAHLPNAELAIIHSPYGHDAFLIELDLLQACIQPWIATHLERRPTPASA